jgi:hypothetical protein
MKDGAARAKKYQARAKQIRAIATDVRSKADRNVLSDIAKEYDEAAKALSAKTR